MSEGNFAMKKGYYEFVSPHHGPLIVDLGAVKPPRDGDRPETRRVQAFHPDGRRAAHLQVAQLPPDLQGKVPGAK